MKCAACGHENNAGARFCANCGATMAGAMLCQLLNLRLRHAAGADAGLLVL
jgi:hypothetical protein